MEQDFGLDECRWEIVKAIIDENPLLREKVKSYIETA
jgi:hypothetical protein